LSSERETYAEVLDVVQDLVIEGEVVAGDDVDTGILLDLPVLESETLGLGQEISLRDLARPVCMILLVICPMIRSGNPTDKLRWPS
jgi:hypothetical protein